MAEPLRHSRTTQDSQRGCIHLRIARRRARARLGPTADGLIAVRRRPKMHTPRLHLLERVACPFQDHLPIEWVVVGQVHPDCASRCGAPVDPVVPRQLVIRLVIEEFIDEHACIAERARDPSRLADEQRVCLPSPVAKPTPLPSHRRAAGAVPVVRRAGPSRLLRAVGRASGFSFGTRAASLFPFFTSRVFWTRGGGQHGAASLPELGNIDQRHPRRSVIAPGQHALSIR